MTSREVALALDAQQRPVEAAEAYEVAIREPRAELDLFLNLAALYAVSIDVGFLAAHRLPDEFVGRAHARAVQVIDEAASRFGETTDIAFWRTYVDFLVGREVPPGTYEGLAQRGDSLLPLYGLFLQSGGTRYRAEAEALRDQMKDRQSERARLLHSVLESALTRNVRSRQGA